MNFEYSTINFRQPVSIKEEQYLDLKEALSINPYLSLNSVTTFKEAYREDINKIYWLVGSGLVILLLYLIFKVEWFQYVLGFLFFGFFINLVTLFKQSESHSTYEMKLDQFEKRIKFAAMTAISFSEFNRIAYTNFFQDYIDDYNLWIREYNRKRL